MKSLSNKTEYDDELFYNAITSSLKTIFTCPIDGIYTITSKNNKDNLKEIIIQAEKPVPIKAVADAKVLTVIESSDGNILGLEHYNKIITTYSFLKNSTIKEGILIKQGEILGYAKELNFTICFDPCLLFNQNKKEKTNNV